MAMDFRPLSILFLIFSSSLMTVRSTNSSSEGNINWWCDKTPHPGPCKYFMVNSHHQFRPHRRSDFRLMLVQLAMERALNAHKQVTQFGPSCENKHQKAAWSDCSKLYQNTILQLNRTLQGLGTNENCTAFDAQTWLSTALTNIQTCQGGSQELNVTDFLTPIMSGNVSEMISNSLAVNGVLIKAENHTEDSPSWVSRHDRRLLEISSSLAAVKANLVVAKDGSGNFKTVQSALNAAAKRSRSGRFLIYVKRGVYKENIEVATNNNDIMLIGDGMTHTIITGSRSVRGGYTTYNSSNFVSYSVTSGIDGLRFIARDITFTNTAGPSKGQAVALRSSSDLSVFYRCAIQGYQDTLMVHSQRQFYRQCYIYGTIDFIFGNAAVVLQNCFIFARRPLKGQANVITAQGRNDPFQNTGIAIHNSRILASNDLKPVVRAFKTYLGRPWQQYSRTVILKTYIDSLVSPFGWSPWVANSNFALDTLYYGEYKNYGPSSSTRYRVKWSGFHVITSATVASQFTVRSLIAGQSWLPSTGVPFTSSL